MVGIRCYLVGVSRELRLSLKARYLGSEMIGRRKDNTKVRRMKEKEMEDFD